MSAFEINIRDYILMFQALHITYNTMKACKKVS